MAVYRKLFLGQGCYEPGEDVVRLEVKWILRYVVVSEGCLQNCRLGLRWALASDSVALLLLPLCLCDRIRVPSKDFQSMEKECGARDICM